MGLELNMNVPVGPMEEQWRSDRKLWLTEDRARVVEDGDPEAKYLYATQDDLVPMSQAQQYGLVPVDPEPETKQQDKPRDKMRSGPGADKAYDLESKTVAELKEYLAARDLPTTGNKAELIERLHDHDDEEEANG